MSDDVEYEHVQCVHCGWSGIREELVCTDEDEENFVYCPDCEQSGGIESEDD